MPDTPDLSQVPAPNLGTMPEGMPSEAPPIGQQQQAPQQPPKQSLTPNFMNLAAALTGKGLGYAPAPQGQPGRPYSRLDAFEEFVGNFLNSFSQGMSQSGQGPAANARGFGAAMQAPYQRQMQQYQLGQQQQLVQAQAQEAAGRGAESEARAKQMGQMVTLPNGMSMPMALAEKVFPAMVQGQSRVQAAQAQKQYLSTPFGIFDTKAGQYLKGKMAGTVTVTPEMAQQYSMPEQLVGKEVKISDLSAMERAGAQQLTAVQGSAGPAIVNKGLAAATGGKQGVTGLGLGSPAANKIAEGKLSLAQASFERDTFGQLFGDLAKQYPSLVSLTDKDGNAMGWKSPAAPTSSIKTQAQQADDLSQLFSKVKAELAKANATGKLGPVAGRINDIMVGKIGADDPAFANIRALGSLTASGMLKAHFGARGGTEMYGHFENLFNVGKMTYGDLVGAMSGFQTFMDQYASRVRTTKGGGSAPDQKLSPGNPFAPKPGA